MPKQKPLQIDLVTIFPDMVDPYLHGAMLGRGEKAGLLNLASHQLRQWTYDRHQSVDDRPFGGGAGMVMKIEPFFEALQALGIYTKFGKRAVRAGKTRVILTSAKGKRFTQQDAVRLCGYDRLVFLCGRYEGVDERVAEHLADEECSIGDFVLTGGELAALTMADAIARLRPGVLGDDASLAMESHTEEGVLEYPQYTRPETFAPRRGVTWRIPDVLLSGHHKEIEKWRKEMSEKNSQSRKTL